MGVGTDGRHFNHVVHVLVVLGLVGVAVVHVVHVGRRFARDELHQLVETLPPRVFVARATLLLYLIFFLK